MAPLEPISRAVLFLGFRQARERYESAKLQDDPAPAFIALFEALSWAVSIDERLNRPAHPELRGLRYARHAVQHMWADALELDRGGADLPITLPMSLFEWRWRQQLWPPPRNRDDEPAYLEHLAGRPARRALEAVDQFLTELSGR